MTDLQAAEQRRAQPTASGAFTDAVPADVADDDTGTDNEEIA